MRVSGSRRLVELAVNFKTLSAQYSCKRKTVNDSPVITFLRVSCEQPGRFWRVMNISPFTGRGHV